MGFGVSVLQRLCKTSVKKNLYFEIKDKVIEESFNGFRADKKKARVKVYGSDSSKEVRARLIEILYDRVAYHKDKFISPILHHELETMEVKKNGKVEHCDGGHDDQVFSYLWALYVFYEGKNLAENFGIQKNTIKTDEDVEIEENSIDEDEAMEKLDLNEVKDPDDTDTLEKEKINKFFEANKLIILNKNFYDSMYQQERDQLNLLMSTNKAAKKAYEDKYHLEPDNKDGGISYTNMPDSVFGNVIGDYSIEDQESNKNKNGNLYNQFMNL